VSRAFIKEDSDGAPPRYPLPPSGDPEFPLAAARALLTAANRAETLSAEEATGYAWGDPRLIAEMTRLRHDALDQRDDRMATLAGRFLRAAGVAVDD
jgi:hypothetical protein